MSLERRLVRKEYRLTRPFANARARWLERQSLIVTLRNAQGHHAEGEAAPLPGFSRDTLADAERALLECPVDLIEDVAEQGFAQPERLLHDLSRLSVVSAPSARFALEIAIVGLVAARRGRAPCSVLRGPNSESRDAVPLAQLVDMARAESEVEVALAAGYSAVKLKLGTELGFDRELEVIARLRARFGVDFGLRLDANQSFGVDQAPARLQALAAFNPEFVEEPTAASHAPNEPPPLPIALDESLTAPAELDEWALAARNVRVLVLKPTLLGGMAVTARFVERARALGLEWILSHTFESSVGYRGLKTLAFTLPSSRLAHGLGPHAALDAAAEALGVRNGKLWAEQPSMQAIAPPHEPESGS